MRQQETRKFLRKIIIYESLDRRRVCKPLNIDKIHRFSVFLVFTVSLATYTSNSNRMTLRRLLDSDWDDDDWNDAYESASTAATISVGIIIAIVVGILVFIVVSVIVCIYCVCKKRTASSGTVLTRSAPQPQVTTYSFPAGTAQQPGVVQPPPPQGYGQYPPAGQPYPPAGPPHAYPPAGPLQAYPPAGPPQAYPPMTAGGWTKPAAGVMAPPPYSPQPAPVALSEQQKASAPPME